jgi:hypothetical protein
MKTTHPPSHHIAVRLDEAVVERIDALLPQLSAPWHEATRSDALRLLLGKGLELAARDPEAVRRNLQGAKRARS